jgi:hypothetical protein
LLIVDSLIISGIKFVLTRLAEAVEAEMYDEGALREELLAAQMKLELGEIDEAEFARIEEQILAGMREVRARRGETAPAPGATFSVESIAADLRHDEDVHD